MSGEDHETPGTKVLAYIFMLWFLFLYATNWIALSENWFLSQKSLNWFFAHEKAGKELY